MELWMMHLVNIKRHPYPHTRAAFGQRASTREFDGCPNGVLRGRLLKREAPVHSAEHCSKFTWLPMGNLSVKFKMA